MSTSGEKKPIKTILLVVGVIAAAYFGLSALKSKGILAKEVQKSVVLEKIDLPTAPKNAQSLVAFLPLPSSTIARIPKSQITFEIWEWNSQLGLILANGDSVTTQGSLMEKYGVNLKLRRNDNVSQMQNNLIKFASDLKDGVPNPGGTHFVAIMGDGYASFLSGIQDKLAELGEEYKAEAIFSCGRSFGEDKFMGPQAWKDNAESAIGGIVSAYLRDGDWNIVMKWAFDNNIPVNPDETTYDPLALNFYAAADYLDAAKAYIEDREVELTEIVNGKRGEKKKFKISGVTSWTPGDVNVAMDRGGLVSIISTKEYSGQMPNVVIGIKKWMRDHSAEVEGMILATTDAGDQIKCFSKSLDRAGEISARVYRDQNGPYWVKYYKGVVQRDKQGLEVELGGSQVHNLADNLELFGLTQGGVSVPATVYTTFGDLVKRLYPKIMPSYPPVTEAFNTTYLSNVASKRAGKITSATETELTPEGSGNERIVSNRSWPIEFETGSAIISKKSLAEMETIFNQLVISRNLKVQIHGHTDNTGDDESNMTLSEKRAFAIKQWLQDKSASNFPENRVKVVAHGETEPVASNDTESGRRKNRRVEIIQVQ